MRTKATSLKNRVCTICGENYTENTYRGSRRIEPYCSESCRLTLIRNKKTRKLILSGNQKLIDKLKIGTVRKLGFIVEVKSIL